MKRILMVLVLVWGVFFGIKTEVFACTAGDRRCTSTTPSDVQKCDADGEAWESYADCGDHGCSGGYCLSHVCTADTYSCSGGNATHCTSNSWHVEEYCSYGCSGSSCNPYVCTQNAKRCSGSNLQWCNSNSWSLVEDCYYGCDATNKTCYDCTSGTERCSTEDGWAGMYSCNGGYWEYNSGCTYYACNSSGTACGGNEASCCNRFLESGCYASLNSSQMCKSGSSVSDSAYIDWNYPNPGDASWMWSCEGELLGCGYGEECATRYCVPACNAGACGGSGGASECNWSDLTDLCSSASTFGSTVDDSNGIDGSFNWTCLGQTARVTVCSNSGDDKPCVATKKVVNGSCNAANQTCSNGVVANTKTEIRADGIYSVWDCNSNCNGTNALGCSYKTCSRVDGVCDTTKRDSCITGVMNNAREEIRADGIYALWGCTGSCSGTTDSSCIYKVCNRVDGDCGSTYGIGVSSCTAPTTTLCGVGAPSAVSTNIATNRFSWTCAGSCSGITDNCLSTRAVVNGLCGTADRGNLTTKPITANALCGFGTPSAVDVGVTTYKWTCTSTCNGSPDSCLATRDIAPTFPPIIGTTDPEPNPSGGVRSHNCKFPDPNQVTISFEVSDLNGIGDIGVVSMRFSGLGTTYTTTPTAAGVVTYSVGVSSIPDDTYNIEVKADDRHPPITSGWVDLDFEFKIWDCQVEVVDGELYDSSEERNLICGPSDYGFTKLIDVDSSFPFGYGNTVDDSVVNMKLIIPDFNHFTSTKADNNTLTWQNTYFLSIETTSNYPGVLKASKIGGTCVSPSVQFSLSNYVNAYGASPKIDIKYSAVMDQKTWFRVRDGSVLAKIKAENYVPVTCDGDDCKTSVNGMVWSNNVNLTDSDESLTSEVQPQPPSENSYESLKNDIYSGLNVGTTFTSSIVRWPEDIGNTRGIIFVEGNLNINQNVGPSGNDYVFFIVKGKITFASNVTQVNGMFYTDTTVEALGENNTQLKILGSLYGRIGVNHLSRSYVTKRKNNTAPAVEVTYDPNLIFKLPKRMWETYDNWTME